MTRSADDFLLSLIDEIRQRVGDPSQGITLDDIKQITRTRTDKAVLLTEKEAARGGFDPKRMQRYLQSVDHEAYFREIYPDGLAHARAFGDVSFYPIMKDHEELVSRYVESLTGKRITLGTFGVLPIGVPNACAFLAPTTGEPVIVFQSGMFSFLNRMTKLAAMTDILLPKAGFEAITSAAHNDWGSGWEDGMAHLISDTLDESPEIEERFLNTMLAFVILGDINTAGPHHVGGYANFVREHILLSAEMFIIGHEFGHILNGDLNSNVVRRCIKTAEEDVEVLQPEHAMEIAADTWGVTLLAKHLGEAPEYEDDGPRALAQAAPDAFFSMIECLERFIKMASQQDDTRRDSHPSPDKRRAAVREMVEILTEWKENPVTFAGKRFEMIFKKLTERTISKFETMAMDNGGLAPVWKMGLLG